jgi:hypothetical protein
MRARIGACAVWALVLACGGEAAPATVEPEPAASAPAAPREDEPTDEPALERAVAPETEAASPALGAGAGAAAAAPVPVAEIEAAPPAPPTEEQIAELRDVIRRVARMPGDRDLQRRARARGVRFLNLTWEDTGRDWGSSVGPNISDLTLEVIDRHGRRPRTRLLPVLRHPNFSDRTADVAAERVLVRVGNERAGGAMRTVPLPEILAHLREHLSAPDDFRPESDDFTAERDTHYLVSAQHVFVPLPAGQRVDFAPVLFNYQSSPGTPAVLCLLVTREGTSIQIIENRYDPSLPNGWGQRLYYNAAGRRTVLTAERRSDVQERIETGGARAADETALDEGADMVMIVQVPLRIPPVMRRSAPSPLAGSLGGGGGGAGIGSGRGASSDVETAVVGHGLDEGPFVELRRRRIRRDPRFPVRVTIQFYKATSNGVVDDADLDAAVAQIARVYDDADYVGSLVVGSTDRPTAPTP